MLTFFTTAKPFKGHDGIIQRNALQSWKLLHPGVEVILFGDDEGAAEVCRDLGLRHEPFVEANESGAKRLDYMFKRAQEISRHAYLCFSNCDILLMSDFCAAFEKALSWKQRFLLVAQRWDTDITEPIRFSDPGWTANLQQLALSEGFRQDEYWIDVFLFPKGQYLDMPPLIVGHCYWDNWMIWRALRQRLPVLDVTSFVMPIHQNHAYNPAFGRVKGVGKDPLSMINLELIGGLKHLRNIKNSTYYMTLKGNIRPRLYRRTGLMPEPVQQVYRFIVCELWLPTWHTFLDLTRPLRNVLGLRSNKTGPRSKTLRKHERLQ